MNPNLLKGKTVIGTEGYVLGEMNGVDIDLNTWQASAFYIVLSNEATSELNLKKPFLRKIMICLPTQLIQSVGDIITLREPVRNLKDIADKEIFVNPPKLEGKKVIGAKGYDVGIVEGLDLDLNNWQVLGLQVSLTENAASELGFKTPFMSKVVVIIPSEIIKEVGNFITLDKATEDLQSLVECIKSCQKRNP